MSYKSRALKLSAFARCAGPIEIDSVAPETVRRFLDGDRPVSTEWFNKFSALKMFFRLALSRGYAIHNPPPISQPKSPRQFRPYIYYSVEEVQKMIRVVDNRHGGNWHLEPYTIRTLILLLYRTGLRIGEAVMTRWPASQKNRQLLLPGSAAQGISVNQDNGLAGVWSS